MKLCVKCGTHRRHKYRSQKSTFCLGCNRKRAADYRNRHRPELREVWRNSQSKCLYGITLDEKQQCFEKQGRRCAICRSAVTGKLGWCTDHSHKKGNFRGVICQNCNQMLGFARDSIRILRLGAKYLQVHLADAPRLRKPQRKPCLVCKKVFQPYKYNIYCSKACDSRAYRQRKRDRQ